MAFTLNDNAPGQTPDPQLSSQTVCRGAGFPFYLNCFGDKDL
jgi:hypothetical protein